MEKKERKNVQREQDNLERKKRKVCKNINGQIVFECKCVPIWEKVCIWERDRVRVWERACNVVCRMGKIMCFNIYLSGHSLSAYSSVWDRVYHLQC